MNPHCKYLLGMGITLTLLLTVACYYVGLTGPFLLDDLANIRMSKVGSLAWDDWVLAITNNYSGRLGRPVSAASFAITTYFGGVEPWIFKTGNLALHMLCGLLILLLTRRIVRCLPNTPSKARAWVCALLVAVIWLLHPLHISTTLYAVQRMAQLSTLFTLLALLAYMYWRPLLIRRPWRTTIKMGVAVGMSGLLGVLSKENAALLPVYLLILETIVFRWRSSTSTWRPLLTFQSLFIIAPLILGAFYLAVHFDGLTRSFATRPFTLVERLLTESNVLWFYLRLILVPDIHQMSLFHDGFPIQRTMDVKTTISLIGHVTLLGSALLLARRLPVYSLGVTFFYAAHLLESTIFPLEIVFEHRNYLAAWGPIFIIAYYGTHASKDLLTKPMVYRSVALFACLIALLSYTSYSRAYIWAERDRLYEHALENQPNSVRALTNYAILAFHKNKPVAGQTMLARAVNLAGPNAIGPAVQLLTTYCNSGYWPENLRKDTLRRLRHGPADAYTRNTLYQLIRHQATGRCPELSVEELIHFNRAFLVNPSNAGGIPRYHALMDYARAVSLDDKHRKTIQLLFLSDTLRGQVPNHAKSLALQGIVLQSLRMGDTDGAMKALGKLVRLTSDPRIPATSRIRPFIAAWQEMTATERYSLVDFSEYRTPKDTGNSPSPDELP